MKFNFFEKSQQVNQEPATAATETPTQLLERLVGDPTFLPKNAEIKKAFPYRNEGAEAWSKFVRENQHIHEVWTEEYIESLATYMRGRVERLRILGEKYPKILEVGAGDGRLAHFLSEKGSGAFNIVATDVKNAGIRAAFPVEDMDYRQALQKYKPSIVISSWMPYKSDFTVDFRKEVSVKEYILIGDPMMTGDAWLSWGNLGASLKDPEEVKLLAKETPPYKKDGFEKYNLNIDQYQICRSDSFPYDDTKHSRTTAFIRNNK